MMKNKIKKIVSMVMIGCLSIGIIGNTGINGDDNCHKKNKNILASMKQDNSIKTKDGKDYIIVTDSVKHGEALRDEYEGYITRENKNNVNNNHMILNANISDEQANALKEEIGVEIVEEDINVTASARVEKVDESGLKKYVDEDVAWNLQMINADNINNNMQNKVKVAIIDSGVDGISGINVKSRVNLVDKDNSSEFMEDFTGHGTSVAGVIMGNDGENEIQGINSEVDLYSIKVLDSKNVSPISRVVEGIYWAIDHDVDIINLSFGTKTYSRVLEQAIEDAYSHNIILVAAGGNTGNVVEYPAAFDEVIAVGSVDAEGKVSDESIIGNEIELMAPGEMIKVAGPFGGVTVANGTSIAAPHVTAVASVLLGKDTSASNEFIRYLMNASAKKINKNGTGYGVVDLKYSLEHYDEIKMIYNSDNKVIREQDNKEELLTFENDDLVEARWGQTYHNEIVQIGYDNINVYLENWEVNRIKYGATAIDTIYPSNYSESNSSSFLHGYGNYVANYIYLTHAAYEIYNDSYTKYLNGNTTVAGASNANIKNRIQNFPWPSYANSNWEKSLIVFGMALHVIADAYAHKAFDTSTGSIININHDNGADNPYVCPGRYEGSHHTTINAMKRYFFNGTTGTYKQFVHNYYTNFKLHKLFTYCQKTTQSEGGSISNDENFLRSVSYLD